MNDNNQFLKDRHSGKLHQPGLDGRIEVRQPLTMPVHLVGGNAADLVLTENVSAHGARVVAKQPWQLGEHSWINSISGEFHLPARVVYCQPHRNNGYCIGLRIQDSYASWWEKSSGSVKGFRTS